jgi:tRNA-specific 2-thiouridylase
MKDTSLRLIVAMSGGVDSSIAAAILKEQGHDVIGVMMSLWSEAGPTGNLCCTPDSMAYAQAVASQLDIPFFVVDAQELFQERVVDFFIKSHKQGNTPNPCIICNRHVRWTVLLAKADEFGATHIATGHYARLRRDELGTFQLLRGIDPQKDQSYVLHYLSQDHFARSLFPLGEFRKPEIREKARQLKLPIAEKPDSQDLCFVGPGNYREFLRRHAPELARSGPILSADGRPIGRHQGLSFYTIGQRKGIRIAAPQPLYVIKKDVAANTLTVGIEGALGRDELTTGPVNWISGMPPQTPFRALIKIRYKAQEVMGTIDPQEDESVKVKFDQPVRDITPGQSAVFYKGEICLGGGIIV